MTETNKKKILVLEDEKPIARVLTLKLKEEGFEVDETHNGNEALAMTEKNVYNLILTDLIVPLFDGFKFIEELKKRGVATPVFVLTNLGQPEDKKRVLENGAKGYFVKTETSLANITAEIKRFLA